MKNLEKMTRKELATLMVEIQIKKGIVSEKNKNYVIKRSLTDNLGKYARKQEFIDYIEYNKEYV